ncbi:CaiB/BaiF CoA transferase family protein [Candidimonas nitroreducens]|uniref:CoA transferase n=1 Tax=Candidimonas nitroreducens TaxID=683354 RepID=A0A225MP72_9BURK|nr:CaiB/BaiF CoA-transferase family protein [Candidimonas nitroreducens]OWT60589.1 CoA transferase [Candidimonas nitroreducens]
MSALLADVRVLDLSRILAGPWATQNLADLGASVVKIERPGAGDDTRHMGPPFFRAPGSDTDGDAAYFMCCNRGKQSVTIDFTRPEGQALVRKLAGQADVLVENYKVGGLRKYGLDYESLAEINPDLVYCSVTGFGQTGPYRERAGYDYLIQAMSGLMSVTGECDELPGGGPQRVGVAVSDLFSGMYATVAILAALRHRDRGGGGQHIDISLLDCQIGTLVNQGLNYLATGQAPVRMGNGHPNIAPYQRYRARDGYLILAVGNDAQFRKFCCAAGRPEMGSDPRYATIGDRVRNRASLNEWLVAMMAERTVDEWVALLERAGVPCGPINSIARVFEDPHVQARGMRVDLEHPVYGSVPGIRNPIRYSKTPMEHHNAPPALGQHTERVLRDLGLSAEDIAGLRADHIV